MPGTSLEIIIIIALILINGLLAMSEMAVVSARKSRLQQRANEGDEAAQRALDLAENPADFLSAVQIGITLVGILAGAFGGATVSESIAGRLMRIPVLAPYAGALSVALVVLMITYLSLVLGELAPKRVALNNPEGIATRIAGPMRVLSWLALPFVRLLTLSTNLVLRLTGMKPSTEPPITEEEIGVLLEQGAEAGVFDPAEQEMVEAVFRLGDRRVGSIMTPRLEIVWLDLEDSPEEIRRRILESPFSRFPVGRGSLDAVVGVAQAKGMLKRLLSGEPLDLSEVLDPPQYVPEGMEVLKVLEMFRETRVHIALVIDEYGGIQGLVTLNNIIEAIVGDIPEFGESEGPDAVRREDGSWLIDGRVEVEELKDLLDIKQLPDEDRGYYHTLGGFVMTYLGHMPHVGDDFSWSGLRFEVVDMDGFRVDKVLVAPLGSQGEEGAEK